ncbi:hypothetical protein GW17_00002536 [Ensete ventricosum]|nr:hypothetical protein GW17_00002536 [Ensete ventricosum]
MAAMNAVFASPSCSSPLSFPRSSSCYRRSIFASNRPHRSGRQSLNKDHSDRRKNDVVEGVSQKRFTGRGKDDRTYLPPDGSRGDAGLSQSQSQSTVDEIGKFEDSAFLNAVVKILANGTPHEDFWKGAEPLRFGRLPCLQVVSRVVDQC